MENPVAPIKAEVDAERNKDPEHGSEHAALPHMEPWGIALHDRHGAETLKIHVDRVRDEQCPEKRSISDQILLECPRCGANEHVRNRSAKDPEQDGEPAAELI